MFFPGRRTCQVKKKTFSASSEKQTEKLFFNVFVSVDVLEGITGKKCSKVMLGLLMNVSRET
jgi:hypothetical protein